MELRSEPSTILDEQKLVRAACEGSREALVTLIRQHEVAVRLFLLHLLRDTAEADDLAQEVFLCMHQRLGEFRGDGSLRTWLLGIAKNLVTLYLRTAVRRRARENNEFVQQIAQWRTEQLEAEPWQSLETEATFGMLRDCINRLSPGGKELVEVHYFQGLKLSSLAKQHGRSEGAVRVMLHRVRDTLRECMNKKLERGTGHGK